ncbi:MAG: zinc ribbon domain-containing protein [Candidatus Binatia bacterium]
MQCQQCQAENQADGRFCESCGAPLALRCQRCGHELSQQAKFCGRCGADAREAALRDQEWRPDAPPAAPDSHPQSERRHLTVLFCDLVGASDIAARLGPAPWQAIAAEYRRSAAAAVTRAGGHVARFIGDGMAAYFGELAEADFHDAIALARTMRARAWELRATISLARLLAEQGQRDAARTQLAAIYDRFTEGLDTVDLREAKQLLDELAA